MCRRAKFLVSSSQNNCQQGNDPTAPMGWVRWQLTARRLLDDSLQCGVFAEFILIKVRVLADKESTVRVYLVRKREQFTSNCSDQGLVLVKFTQCFVFCGNSAHVFSFSLSIFCGITFTRRPILSYSSAITPKSYLFLAQ